MKLFISGVFVLIVAGCAANNERICEPGLVRHCPCSGTSLDGAQACDQLGNSWLECDCPQTKSAPEAQKNPEKSIDNQPFVPEKGGITKLPAPRKSGGAPLTETILKRRSVRLFSPKALPIQTLSDLLWSAWGISRSEDGKRTAPSVINRQCMKVYVATEDGLFLYRAKTHDLKTIHRRDIRALTGKQGFVTKAPVNLIYVADLSKTRETDQEELALHLGVETGVIAENVYLFCASEGLATVVRGWIDREALTKAMNLDENHRMTFAQTVGYPLENEQ